MADEGESPGVALAIELVDGVPTVNFEIPFYSESDVKVAYNSLRIDEEPSRSNVVKEMSTRDNMLIVKFSSPDARRLKSAAASFLDYAHLVMNSISRFAPRPATKYTERKTKETEEPSP